jgi:hypothetical protein
MSMFVTSAGRGSGNLGGIAGADGHCQMLARAVGSTRTWRAYLSVPARDGAPAIHARERIGQGPWFNREGVGIAASVEELHGSRHDLRRMTALTEKGERVPVNIHDMLTGSAADGRLSRERLDATCNGWTRDDGGRAMLGHSDASAGSASSMGSFNAAHMSQGCSAKQLDSTGGAGRFYCFAID